MPPCTFIFHIFMLKFNKKFIGAITFLTLVATPLQMVDALVIENGGGGYNPPAADMGNKSAKVPIDGDYKGPPSDSGNGTGNTSAKVPIDDGYKGPPTDSGNDTGNTSNKVPIDDGYKGPPQGEVSTCNGIMYPTDIDGHWAEIYIRRLYDLCILEGYNDGKFRPDQKVTRAELTKMALASRKIEPNPGCYDADCGSPFTDLDAWQGKWIRPAFDRNIVQGYS